MNRGNAAVAIEIPREVSDRVLREVFLADVELSYGRRLRWLASWLWERTCLTEGGLLPVGGEGGAYVDYEAWMRRRNLNPLPKARFGRTVAALARWRAELEAEEMATSTPFLVQCTRKSAGVFVTDLKLLEGSPRA